MLDRQNEVKLAETIASFKHDALGFVMFNYPWRMKNGPLEHREGPNRWQKKLLEEISNHSYENELLKSMGLDMRLWRSAVASGHGIGKSAFVAWIIDWLMSTRMKTRGVVTASTSGQLETKTWPELAKWRAMALNSHWFTWTSTTLYSAALAEAERKNWMVTAATVSAENTEAFAGLHNEGRTVFIIEDEASGVEPKISEIAHGAFTDGEGFWMKFGNPTRPDGPFYDCFHKNREFWHCVHVDSREVDHTNKLVISETLKMFGPDSDEARIRVYGQFPSKAYDGYISADLVRQAQEREMSADSGAALIMAVDVARFGDDDTVICFRQGRDARSIRWYTFRGKSTMELAQIIVDLVNTHNPDVVVVEGTGVGAGVVDRCRELGVKIIEVHPGSQPTRPELFVNKRAELWSKARDWTITGCLPVDPKLFDQLTSMKYLLGNEHQKLQMETKKSYKERKGESPDRADAFILTFGTTVVRRDIRKTRSQRDNRVIAEYDELAY